MKKLYYLLALIAVGFASCDPLSQTYKDIDAKPAASTLTFSTTTTYASGDAAKTGLSALLNTKYGNLAEGSTASITFPYSTTVVIPTAPDFLLSHVGYTAVAADYSGTSFTTAQAVTFLTAKYPTPVANQLVVLTYNYLESGVTPSTGVITTDSYMFLSGIWTKIYTLSAAQYTAAGRGTNLYFVTNDLPNIPGVLSSLLLDDPMIPTPKVGDVKYVSYKYNGTSQNVLALMFDGTKWADQATFAFLKLNGTWVPDPTVYVNEPAAANNPDYLYLQTTTIGTDAARAGTARYGDFELRTSNAAVWQADEITRALAAILLHKFPTATVGVPYKITYVTYPGSSTTVSTTFIFNGTAFVIPPQ
ncbi:hypothetical protein BDD43_4688 [Mucilaginibacter gracilis]|uniref:Uncharacterized protein n=1 Tax=Mucilaginibacter gracilis TaxID=423350 RepID=A0A495J6V5_9SPHI|nr:hypothetical protein [Mucilaginibacter gracilis]RKR84451.1 hypothetical protein BDD43_4688 [Mucilaginibacter gracilis]